ncbi:MAG: aminodeoxychorismate/anthranilate synthase component II [Syntrophales bacterium]|nr:aminodeoxychorismate/anthranilate synthase component II [Syntrophales bacterium]
MILIIDNYDSFTYNLLQYVGQLGKDCLVRRNDEITLEEVECLNPGAIIISPGPGTPEQAGITVPVICKFYKLIPILGVCLGHQSLCYAFGSEITRASSLMHGKTSLIKHDGQTIFKGLPNPFIAGRYHSLIVRKESVPSCLKISAETEEGEVMAVRHRDYLVEGVQFHPESVLTPQGKRIIRNFLDLVDERGR